MGGDEGTAVSEDNVHILEMHADVCVCVCDMMNDSEGAAEGESVATMSF